MTDVPRIGPRETRTKVQSGDALLVCAYDSDDKFLTVHLDGAISLSEFRQQSASLPKDKEIIFY